MKILFDLCQIRAGGGLQVSLGLIDFLRKEQGIEKLVVCSNEVGNEAIGHGIYCESYMETLPRCKNSLARFFQPRKYLPRYEKKFNPDLVFTLFGPAYWTAKSTHLVGFAKAHYIYPDYNPGGNSFFLKKVLVKLVYKVKSLIQIKAFKKADFLVTETETVRQQLSKMQHIPIGNIFVVPNCYSPYFSELINKNQNFIKRTLKISILVPSSYYPHKNLEIIPKVAAWMKTQLPEEFEFIFTLDAAPWKIITDIAKKEGVETNVRNLGKIPNSEIALHYLHSDVVFLPTLLECSTAVYPECFLAKRPLVTSDLLFAKELCGKAAVYCDPHSIESCGGKIIQIIEDKPLRDDIVKKGCSQLKIKYTTPEGKWENQKRLLNSIVSNTKS